MTVADLARALGIEDDPRWAPITTPEPPPGIAYSENPAIGEPIAAVRLDDAASYERTAAGAAETFRKWRQVPAPVRGQVVRAIGDEFRRLKEPLGRLVSL